MADISRTHLPIPRRQHVGLTTYDAKDPETSFPPIEALRPPASSPNVVVVMIDDAGFGASSVFGGPCHHAQRAAPRRAGIAVQPLSHHRPMFADPPGTVDGSQPPCGGDGRHHRDRHLRPGYDSVRPDTAAPVAEILRLNGFSTAAFGKCHEVPVWETSPMGPFTQWPTGSGFEHFYGFVGAETNQWYPALYDGTTPVEPAKTPEEGYHFTEDMTDRAISWVRQQKSLMPDKQFFMYFAPGATHAPHHVPAEWADKYKGHFDAGWDALRDETLARQKQLGVVPPDTELSARPAEIQAWDDVPAGLKPVLARQMEIYAGFLEHTDHHIGRLLDALEVLGVLDNTLVYLIIGDNGASAEGTPNGTFNEIISLNGAAAFETTEFMAERIDKFGTPAAYNHYAVGWAHAMDTPYQWTKQVASHFGGTRNGTIIALAPTASRREDKYAANSTTSST